ncbi:MAG: glycoside hydrolase family 32 protein, partial [Chitinophagaceae bacterium]|nr:glycoside hydrolase family 32 protein [Chitinophagaceae bacterium]
MYKSFAIKLSGLLLAGFLLIQKPASSQEQYQEQFRPQVHFSPQAHWTNDPNGMVYYNGVYHLFFQYYPDST